MAEMTPEAVEQQASQARGRLIDHFKRVYSIIAGLAITEACKRLWPVGAAALSDVRTWMFLTFFITVVPIFHGGDRSLDHKYLASAPESGRQRLYYVYDVYILLITALLFVFVAESVPDAAAAARPALFHPEEFYFWMFGLFAFDVVVLLVDSWKTNDEATRRAYPNWIFMNSVLAFVCFVVATAVQAASGTGYAMVRLPPGIDLTLSQTGFVVFTLAFLRTIFDYRVGGKFMFP
jgi:hypothetical protein